MPSAVSKATASSQPDYHIVSVRLAACDAYPATNSDQTTRAAVYSFQSVAERSSSSHLHQHASGGGGGGGGGQAPDPALVTSVGEWIMQRVIETPEWLIRIVRRSLEDDTLTTSKTKSKSSTQATTTITSTTPLPEAVLLSSGLGRDLLVLLSEHARPPRNLADIPRVGIAASVLDINDMMERGNKTESDIIAENGTISPGDYLFEHIDYAKKMMKRSKDVFLYLTTEKHHFKRKKSDMDAGRRPYVYRLFMRGPFSEDNAVLEQVTDPEKEWPATTDGNGSPGTFDEDEPEDEEPDVGDDNDDNEDDRIDMLIHAGENSASSQEEHDDSSDAGDQDGDDEKEATAAAKRLQHLSQAASPRSNSDEKEEDASSIEDDGNEMEDQDSSRAELRGKKLPTKASTSRHIENSVDEEESDDDDSDEDAMAKGTNKGNFDEAASVSEEEEEADVEIFGEDDDDDDYSADYAAFTPREIIYLSRIFRGGSIPAKELKWVDMKKANKKDILFARRVVKKLLRKRKRPKQARKPIKKVQESQVPGNEDDPVQVGAESNAKTADPMMVQNDDSRDGTNESRASLPSSADVQPPSTEVRELYEVKNESVASKSPPKRDVQVAPAGVSRDMNVPKVPLIEQAGDAESMRQAEPAEEPASVGDQQPANDDTKRKQGRPKGAKNKRVPETNAMDTGKTDVRPSSGKDNQAQKKGSMPKTAKDGVNEELEGSKPSSSEDNPDQDEASVPKAAKEGVNEGPEGSQPKEDHVRPDNQTETSTDAGPAETSKGPSHTPNVVANTPLDPSDPSKAQDKLTAESKEQQEESGISKTPPQVIAGTTDASSTQASPAPDKASNVPPVEPVSVPPVQQSLSQTKPVEPQKSIVPVDKSKGEESSKKRGRPKGSKNKKKDEEGEEGASKKRKKKDGDKAKEKSAKKEKRESKKRHKRSHAAPDAVVGPNESTDDVRASAPTMETSQSVAVGESEKHSSEAAKSKNKEHEKLSNKKSEHGTKKDDHDAPRQEVGLSAEEKSSPREGESGSS